ncbi:hypothetical protein OAF54_00265 [bacterium]|nr:hypothetical protein [bacterium]
MTSETLERLASRLHDKVAGKVWLDNRLVELRIVNKYGEILTLEVDDGRCGKSEGQEAH